MLILFGASLSVPFGILGVNFNKKFFPNWLKVINNEIEDAEKKIE